MAGAKSILNAGLDSTYKNQGPLGYSKLKTYKSVVAPQYRVQESSGGKRTVEEVGMRIEHTETGARTVEQVPRSLQTLMPSPFSKVEVDMNKSYTER